MKIITKILKFIVMTIIVLCLTYIGIKNIACSTIFNKEYIIKKLDETNFYSETYKLVESNFENYIGQSGLEEDVIKNICTEDKVRKDINIILSNIYNGTKEEIDTSEIANKLNSNIDEQNVRTAKNSEAINEFVEHICQSYKDTIISTKYDATINNQYEKIIQKLGKIETIIIVVLIISIIILIALNIKDLLKILLNLQTISLATAIMQFAITITINKNVNIPGIKAFNEAFSMSIVTIIQDIFGKINKFGIILLIIYVIFVIIYSIVEKCTKSNNSKIEEE